MTHLVIGQFPFLNIGKRGCIPVDSNIVGYGYQFISQKSLINQN